MTTVYLDLAKYLASGIGAMAVPLLLLMLREAKRRGREEVKSEKIDKALVILDDLGPQIVKLAGKVEQLADASEATRRRLFSEYPKAFHSLDRRMSKVEWHLEIEPTGVYTIPPPGESNGKE